MHRTPLRGELTRLLERRLYYLRKAVRESVGYRVLGGVPQLGATADRLKQAMADKLVEHNIYTTRSGATTAPSQRTAHMTTGAAGPRASESPTTSRHAPL